jgi:hypothetical protein
MRDELETGCLDVAELYMADPRQELRCLSSFMLWEQQKRSSLICSIGRERTGE